MSLYLHHNTKKSRHRLGSFLVKLRRTFVGKRNNSILLLLLLLCLLSVFIIVSIGSSLSGTVESIKPEQDVPKDEIVYETAEAESCPLAVRKNIGLFNKEKSNSHVKDDFPDTILLVSSNYAYYDMLQNWEFLADEQDLKWAVLAMDQRLYDELGPERAVLTDTAFSTSGTSDFASKGFVTLTCNKLRMVLDIYEKCDLNIVFSDADNIFFKNPFEHDLGRLIQSNRYDYIYQPNKRRGTGPHQHPCMKGDFDRENNTGFYYVRRKSEVFSSIMERTLTRCNDPENKIDDQTLFWYSYWYEKKKLGENANFHHCGSKEENLDISESLEAKSPVLSFDICCMDPYYYPIGQGGQPPNKDPVTFHANYVQGYKKKVKLLKKARGDKYGWDVKRFRRWSWWFF